MASKESVDSSPALGEQEDPTRVQRKLIWRMGVAGLTIVVLLGGLTVFDRLSTAPDAPQFERPRFTEPVPVPGKTTAQGPVVPMEPDPEPEEEAVPEPPSVPESTSGPAVPHPVEDIPPPPEAAAPRSGAGAARGPVSAAPRAGRHASRAPSAAPPAASSTPKPAPGMPPPDSALPETPEEATPSVRLPDPPPSAMPRLPSGYVLQAGVFADPLRAEDMVARLRREGIPATLETRVVVGPFKNRSEAESARAKMKRLGINALPAPARGRK